MTSSSPLSPKRTIRRRYAHYAERSVQAADGFDAELDLALKAIAADPQRFPLCDDRHRFFLMRRYPYQVIYRELADHVAVIAIAHVRRDPAFWSSR